MPSFLMLPVHKKEHNFSLFHSTFGIERGSLKFSFIYFKVHISLKLLKAIANSRLELNEQSK